MNEASQADRSRCVVYRQKIQNMFSVSNFSFHRKFHNHSFASFDANLQTDQLLALICSLVYRPKPNLTFACFNACLRSQSPKSSQ
jgi:hypothetical protein